FRPLRWISSSKKDLLAMPDEVQQAFGFALYHAQIGLLHPDAKPLMGFGSAGILEIVEDWRGDGFDSHTIKGSRDAGQRSKTMSKVQDGVNVYAELGFKDADEMLVKAQLV